MLDKSKQELLNEIKKLDMKLKEYKIYYNQEGFMWPALGYFFDENKKRWIVFETTERTIPCVYLETSDELEAVLKLYKKVSAEYEIQERNKQIENQK